MIFGAKIQIFQKLTIELKKCHFWRENSNETILMHCVKALQKGAYNSGFDLEPSEF